MSLPVKSTYCLERSLVFPILCKQEANTRDVCKSKFAYFVKIQLNKQYAGNYCAYFVKIQWKQTMSGKQYSVKIQFAHELHVPRLLVLKNTVFGVNPWKSKWIKQPKHNYVNCLNYQNWSRWMENKTNLTNMDRIGDDPKGVVSKQSLRLSLTWRESSWSRTWQMTNKKTSKHSEVSESFHEALFFFLFSEQ